jgi:hypothetical protein
MGKDRAEEEDLAGNNLITVPIGVLNTSSEVSIMHAEAGIHFLDSR